MLIELTCTICDAVYVPTRADLLLGPAWYRRCPACRTPPIESEAAIPIPPAAA